MKRPMQLLSLCMVVLLGACGDSNSPPADPITGNWSGKFDNGITITAALTLSGSTISGTFDTGDSNGNVTGIYSSSTFDIDLTALSGTQRNLTSPLLINGNTRITANWDDGAGGLSGAMCLAKSGSTACP